MQSVRIPQQADAAFPPVISWTSPLFLMPLATFSDHFAMQILSTQVKKA